MDRNSFIDIVIGDWSPPIRSDLSLDLYLKQTELLFGSGEQAVQDWQHYQLAIKRHFGRLLKFKNSEIDKFQNLVYGNIQSGKTAHLLANICWAKDNALDLVIVFSGGTTPLNDQTTERLKADLPAGTANVKSVPTEVSENQIAALSQDLHSSISERVSNARLPIPVLVMLKNPNRLGAMGEIQSRLQSRFTDSLSVMVIDDEADQASPDATLRARTPRNPKSRTTHEGILGLAGEVKGKKYYLSYTATPEALLLGEGQDFLQPQFCSVVPSGSNYVGIERIVAAPDILISTSAMNFRHEKLSKVEENVVALENLMGEFVVESWLHKSHPNIFHNASEDYSCSHDSVQMLVHPSAQQANHRQYVEQITEIKRSWIGDLNSERSRTTLVDLVLLPAYQRVSQRISNIRNYDILTQEFFLKFLDHLYQLLSEQGKLEILEVNSNQRSALRREGRERDFLPNKPEEWKGRDWILVGGDILGRGLTIPHLTITLILRNPNVPNFDIGLQQMRFCGYRANYSHLMRVCAPADVVEDYRLAAQIERLSRRKAIKWDETNLDLIQNPPTIRFQTPTASRYRPTRLAVTSLDVQSRDISKGFFAFRETLDVTRFISNFNLLNNCLTTHSDQLRKEGAFLIFSFERGNFITILKAFSVAASDKSNFDSFIELLEDEFFPTSPFELVVDESLRTISTIEPVQFLQRLNIDQKTHYSRSILPSDLTKFPTWGDSTHKYSGVRVQTVVGLLERKLPDLHPESVVVCKPPMRAIPITAPA